MRPIVRPRFCSLTPCPRCGTNLRVLAMIKNKSRCVQCFRNHIARYREKNPNSFKDWRAKNIEKDRASSRAWQKSNRAKVRVHVNERTSARKRSQPRWVDREQLRGFYTVAQRLSTCTGIKHHVDHILPLRGKLVSGLHVPWNLCVVPAVINLRKGDRV